MVTGDRFIRSIGLLLCVEEWVERLIAWQWLQYVAFAPALVCLVMILYRFSAPLKKPRLPVFPGTASTAVIMTGAPLGFSAFMGHSIRYSLVYGSLASVIILLIGNICAAIFLFWRLVDYMAFMKRKRIHKK